MYLVIAEKPAVAKMIADVLGATGKKRGYQEGNDCIVSWCLGHLAQYSYPEAYDPSYKNWKFEDLPIIPKEWELTVARDKEEQFRTLKELLNRPDMEYVVNACDAGREGELIFRHIYHLSGTKLPVERLWISSLEDSAIREGFQNIKSGSEYENLANAAVCRSKADWLVGMNATRAYTSTYYKKLTVGRVQTPTLAMLVERDDQIRGFQKEKYFNVELGCDGLKAVKEQIREEAEAQKLCDACKGQKAVVVSVEEKKKTKVPPELYDLTTLQRDANRIYGMTAKRTLDAAQSLYEQKLLTYPRTDSRYLTEDMESTAERVIQLIYQNFQILSPFDRPSKPDLKKVMDNQKVSDHHAIIPTMELGRVKTTEFKTEELNVLRLVMVRLLEATSKEYIYEDVQANISCGEDFFLMKGKRVLQDGWKIFEECFKNEDFMAVKQMDDPETVPFPHLEIGQKFFGVTAKTAEKYTTPPKSYNEDLLLRAMENAGKKEFDSDTEKKGLGTPATRANIIEKLVHDGYAVRKGKNLIPTEDGRTLISVMPEYLRSASMTAEWENQLLQIERGELPPKQFLDGIEKLVGMVLTGCEALTPEERTRFSKRKGIGTCPACGSMVFEGPKSFYCGNRECSFTLWKNNYYLINMNKEMDADLAGKLLADGKARVKDLYSRKKDMYFTADLRLDVKDGQAHFSLEFPDRKGTAGSHKNKN